MQKNYIQRYMLFNFSIVIHLYMFLFYFILFFSSISLGTLLLIFARKAKVCFYPLVFRLDTHSFLFVLQDSHTTHIDRLFLHALLLS